MKSDPVEAAIEAMERKPTASALRAADFVWKEEVSDVGLCPRLEKQRRIAEIIDRETGLPELIEACKSMLEWMEFTIPRLNESNTDRMNWGGPISKARNAIAKAEGT